MHSERYQRGLSKAVSFAVTPDTYRRAERLASKSRLSKSEILRRALESGLDKVERDMSRLYRPTSFEELGK